MADDDLGGELFSESEDEDGMQQGTAAAGTPDSKGKTVTPKKKVKKTVAVKSQVPAKPCICCPCLRKKGSRFCAESHDPALQTCVTKRFTRTSGSRK